MIPESVDIERNETGGDPFSTVRTIFPRASFLRFRDFNCRYAGRTCYMIGRGPTRFDYGRLRYLADPVFFINDAVCLEKYVRSDSFFFAHDHQLRPWLDGSIRSTAVLPVEGQVLVRMPRLAMRHAGLVVLYHRVIEDRGDLLSMNRDQIADRAGLVVHSGTIHSAIHFAWFCGFARIVFIGCDGINTAGNRNAIRKAPDGYDPRLENRSRSVPDCRYDVVRKAQDLMIALFGIDAVYAGTPTS
jgi:hypothetical protein